MIKIKVTLRVLNTREINIGNFDLYEIDMLVELYKKFGAYLFGLRYEYHSSQFLPDEESFEIILNEE